MSNLNLISSKIKINCTKCNATYKIKLIKLINQHGKHIKCKKCQNKILLPAIITDNNDIIIDNNNKNNNDNDNKNIIISDNNNNSDDEGELPALSVLGIIICLIGTVIAILFAPCKVMDIGVGWHFILGDAGMGLKYYQLIDNTLLLIELIIINGFGISLFFVGKKTKI